MVDFARMPIGEVFKNSNIKHMPTNDRRQWYNIKLQISNLGFFFFSTFDPFIVGNYKQYFFSPRLASMFVVSLLYNHYLRKTAPLSNRKTDIKRSIFYYLEAIHISYSLFCFFTIHNTPDVTFSYGVFPLSH